MNVELATNFGASGFAKARPHRWIREQRLDPTRERRHIARRDEVSVHHIFQRLLGDDMGYASGKEFGVNPYGNTIIVNGKFLRENKSTVAAFVKVSQKAFHACATDATPCIAALVEANKGLKVGNETTNWGLVKQLMTDKTSTTKGLGYMDEGRMVKSYKLFASYLDKPFDMSKHFTNEFIDTSIKMPQ